MKKITGNKLYIFLAVFLIDIVALIYINSLIFFVVLAFLNIVVIARLTTTLPKEFIILGSIVALVESYHFYFQPALNLPVFNGPVLIFVGSLLFLRALFMVALIIPIPIVTQISAFAVGR